MSGIYAGRANFPFLLDKEGYLRDRDTLAIIARKLDEPMVVLCNLESNRGNHFLPQLLEWADVNERVLIVARSIKPNHDVNRDELLENLQRIRQRLIYCESQVVFASAKVMLSKCFVDYRLYRETFELDPLPEFKDEQETILSCFSGTRILSLVSWQLTD